MQKLMLAGAAILTVVLIGLVGYLLGQRSVVAPTVTPAPVVDVQPTPRSPIPTMEPVEATRTSQLIEDFEDLASAYMTATPTPPATCEQVTLYIGGGQTQEITIDDSKILLAQDPSPFLMIVNSFTLHGTLREGDYSLTPQFMFEKLKEMYEDENVLAIPPGTYVIGSPLDEAVTERLIFICPVN